MESKNLDYISPQFAFWHDTEKSPLIHSDDTYGQRIVQYYEIEYIISSRNGYILTDSLPIPALPQTVFFRYPGMIVEGIGVYRSIYVEFDLNLTKEQAGVFYSLPSFFKNTDSVITEAVMNLLYLPANASTAQKLIWKAKILELLAYLLQCGQDTSNSALPIREQRHLQPVKNALFYVQQHYAENITLQNLADVSGYSIYYFCKLFKHITQLTPMQYVVRYRMEQAEKRLLFSDDSIEKIMLDTGFHNYGYFWRTFKDIYGISPQAHRKKRH